MAILGKILIALAVLIALYIGRLGYLARTTQAEADFAVAGPLLPCDTAKPNCVSSLNNEEKFAILPISIAGLMLGDVGEIDGKRVSDVALSARLIAAIKAQPGAEIKFIGADRVDASFRSKLMGYIDDASFVIDVRQAVIHFKSRSRVGYSDLGVNRKRMEAVRAAFAVK
jgi:uncharacterized protein (DUF1499 family)